MNDVEALNRVIAVYIDTAVEYYREPNYGRYLQCDVISLHLNDAKVQ